MQTSRPDCQGDK